MYYKNKEIITGKYTINVKIFGDGIVGILNNDLYRRKNRKNEKGKNTEKMKNNDLVFVG